MADLKAFVQEQLARQVTAQTVDWSKRRAKWLAELNALYKSIQNSLVVAGFPEKQITHQTHFLSEETLGRYEAPVLVVNLPVGEKVVFLPVASVIVGGYGRIDVTGPGLSSAKLIANDAQEDRLESDETPSYERDWAWHVYPSRGMRQSFLLDDQGLAQLLGIVTGSN